MVSLSSRRGRIQSQEDRGRTQALDARVPLSEMFGYSSDLRERTRGRGAFVMQFDHYQRVRRSGGDDGEDSFIGARRRPSPPPKDAGIALPEPEDGTPQD